MQMLHMCLILCHMQILCVCLKTHQVSHRNQTERWKKPPHKNGNLWETSGQFQGNIILKRGDQNVAQSPASRRPNNEVPHEIDTNFKEYLRELQNPWENSGHYQGDMPNPNKRTAIIDETYRWPSREIPYEVDNRFRQSQIDEIDEALAVIARRTCIKPRPRTRRDTQASILFTMQPGRGCYSFIGCYHKMQQEIYLDPAEGCVHQSVIMHEFLHTLGLYHEQSSPDRDNFIKINWENIKEGQEFNFDKANVPTTRFGFDYDYYSIMHYSAYAFTKNGRPTIEAKNPNHKIIKNRRLSETDIKKISRMYHCA